MKLRISVLNDFFVVLESEKDIAYVWLVEEVTQAKVGAILEKIQKIVGDDLIELELTPEADELLFPNEKDGA